MHLLFEHLRFTDADAAEARLQTLLQPEQPGFAEHLAQALSECADPGLVLVSLERFLESCCEREAERGLMARELRFARLLCILFDQSHFLTDILCRRPEYARWLFEEAVLDGARPRDDMAAEIRRCIADAGPLAECGRLLREYKQREFLRIAAREVFVHAPLGPVTEDLSNLADAFLQIAVERCARELESRYGRPVVCQDEEPPREAGFAVIGLGKLGGGELNFSSDIDLLFLYSDEAATSGGPAGSLSTLDYFHKLGEMVIKLVSEQTAEGILFRIDMRLRPHGRASPLAISMARALEYYGSYAQAWERQALIKARAVAGDIALGERFIERTRPFVFPRYFDDATLDAIRQIKKQTEALVVSRGQADLEVKLGRGGIRDIEFTVQMLQMLNGGRMPELRTPKTLEAIRALGLRGHLSVLEASALASHYAFLRQVEHRLQIEGSQQRHMLPADPQALERFARRLGYASAQSFMTAYRDRTGETRAILDRFLATEGSGRLWTYDLLSPESDGAIGLERLARYGFQDPERARQELLLLSAGPAEQPYPFHVRRHFADIVPTLLEALGESGEPDMTLVRLGRLLTQLKAPGILYETLKANRAFCGYLAVLAANSPYLTEILIRDPGLFDVFGSGDAANTAQDRGELENELAILSGAYESEAAPYRLRDAELLRIAMRDLFGEAPVTQIGEQLTQLAEVCLVHALARARADVNHRYGSARGGFALLGLGKLGGREMGYGSDLDLVFVYDGGAETETGMDPSEYFATVASRTIQRLKEPTRYGTLYDIDARLRPDGRKGVLAVSGRRLAEYYREEAQGWERLALTKVRAVAGEPQFGVDMQECARDIAFSLPLTPENLAEIDAIRARIAATAAPLDLKRDEGGLVELEFAVRLLQLRHVATTPALRCGGVAGALETLRAAALYDAGELDTLANAYRFFRRVENRIRMMHGRAESALPEDAGERADLARRLRFDGDLAAATAEFQQAVHAVYRRVMETVVT